MIILNIDKARRTNNIAKPPITKGFCKLACILVPDAAIIVPAIAYVNAIDRTYVRDNRKDFCLDMLGP